MAKNAAVTLFTSTRSKGQYSKTCDVRVSREDEAVHHRLVDDVTGSVRREMETICNNYSLK